MERFNFNVQIKEVKKINPLFSQCKVYICYSDLNRNNSDIPKNVINDNLYSLYGCPIVGEFSKSKDDFLDHGGAVEIDDNGEYQYVNTTIPYGYIGENSIVQWETVDGEEYLTATGYLWTGRYPEASKAIEEGRPQSMEIDQVEGKFNKKKNFEVSSFVFSALCILGNDVEPCFEEAKIVAYSLDKDKFKEEFTQMIAELKFSLQQNQSTSNSTPNPEVDNINTPKGGNKVKKSERILALFSLSQEQLEDQLKNELAELESFELWEGYEVARFSFVDYYVETKIVIAYDRKDGRLVGFAYDVFGDNVEITADSGKPYKITYEPLIVSADPDNDDDVDVDIDEDNGATLIPEDFAQLKIEKLEKDFSVEKETLTAEKESLIAEKENFTAELSAKDSIITEKEDAILALDAKFQAITEESNAKDATIETLTNFKLEVEQSQRKEKVEALFSKFSRHLSKEEMEEFRTRESEFASYDLFEKEVKSFAADKLIEIHTTGKTEFSNMAIVDNNLPENKTEDEPKDVFSKLEAKMKK